MDLSSRPTSAPATASVDRKIGAQRECAGRSVQPPATLPFLTVFKGSEIWALL
jgi:hypothetical protein